VVVVVVLVGAGDTGTGVFAVDTVEVDAAGVLGVFPPLAIEPMMTRAAMMPTTQGHFFDFFGGPVGAENGGCCGGWG
jgi:hypothetical protein